jgi:hypothetical protein
MATECTALERATHVKQLNTRALHELRDLREKESVLRRSLLDDWLPNLERQCDEAAQIHSDLRQREEASQQLDAARLGIATAVVASRSAQSTASGGAVALTSEADELRLLMRGHVLLLRELDLKHQKAAKRTVEL